MKIRFRFSKGTPLKFISHLDLQRLFIRALRRARIPVSYKRGFNPQPKLSFASALPLGCTSSGEYLEFEIENRLEPHEIKERVSGQLPFGISIFEAEEVPCNARSLMAQVRSFLYRISFETDTPLKTEELKRALSELLAREEVKITRRGKKGPKQFNVIPYIKDLKVLPQGNNSEHVIEICTRMSPEGTVKPVEIMKLLEKDNSFKITKMEIHREAIYI